MIALKWENVFNSKHMTVEQHKEFHKDLKDNEIINVFDVFKYIEDYCNI
jgi:hypothetical protein